MPNYYHTRIKSFRHLGLATHNYFSAWTKVWTCICPSAPSITAPGGRSGQILDVLGRLATYSSHHVRTITRIKLYRHLLMFLNKDSSAWAAVWACSCCSRLSITPSKADLDRFGILSPQLSTEASMCRRKHAVCPRDRYRTHSPNRSHWHLSHLQ